MPAGSVVQVRRIRRADHHASAPATARSTAKTGKPANRCAVNGTPNAAPASSPVTTPAAGCTSRNMIMKNGAWARPGRSVTNGPAPAARCTAMVADLEIGQRADEQADEEGEDDDRERAGQAAGDGGEHLSELLQSGSGD